MQQSQEITLKLLSSFLANRAKVTSVGNAQYNAENALDNPNLVVLVESQIAVSGPEFTATFTPNSVTILRLTARSS